HAAGPAEDKEIIDQQAEAAASLNQVVDVLLSLRPQLVAVVLGEKIAERLERTQRFLEIVRDDVGEFLKFLIDAAQLRISLLQFLCFRLNRVRQPSTLRHVLGGAA